MTTVPAKVLIVDDDDSIRESLTAHFEDDDFEVHSAVSAEEALHIMESRAFDVVVVDMRLPGIDGSEFIRRSHQFWPEVSYLIFTGSTRFELPKNLKALPCVSNTVYQKPLSDLNILSVEVRRLTAEKENTNE